MSSEYIVKAISRLKPDSQYSFTNHDYATVKWDVIDGDAPTQKEIDDTIKLIKTEEKSEAKNKEIARQAILDRLGLTADELQTILG